MKMIVFCLSLAIGLASAGEASPQYKIHLDPSMTVAGYANLQVDRKISETLTTGAMFWHTDEQLWSGKAETSVGIRLDWFEQSPFVRGWHSNSMIKVDLVDWEYARSRLKFTQTYQMTFGELFVNLGIGVQFVSEAEAVSAAYDTGYRSWLLPAYELSLSRAF